MFNKRSESSAHASSALTDKKGQVFRIGSLFTIAIVSVVPPLIVILAALSGSVSERTMTLAFAGWALMISVASVLIAHAPALQRMMFVADLDVAAVRWRLWALGAYGILIAGFCVGNGL